MCIIGTCIIAPQEETMPDKDDQAAADSQLTEGDLEQVAGGVKAEAQRINFKVEIEGIVQAPDKTSGS